MSKSRYALVALVATAAFVLGGSALAHPPGGNEDTNNQVTCHGTSVPGTRLDVDAHGDGAGVCNDGGPVPIQGRVIVHAGKLYVAADGDASNPAPLDGFVRVGVSGSGCGSSSGNQDSHNGGKLENCDAS